MRLLILSDIHANLDALDSVMTAAAGAWDRALVLGDLVGYGADPNGVVDRVRALTPLAVIRGNHDKAACGITDASDFNHVARTAALWTASTLTPQNRDYLVQLPPGPVAIDDHVEICHGSPFDEDYYIFDLQDATRALAAASRPLCLFGHTHIPAVVASEGTPGVKEAADGSGMRLELNPGARYLVNPGSVGQPRDGDPRAAFAIYDSSLGVVTIMRVDYAVDAAQRRIFAAGLPASLAQRLAVGR